MEGFLRILGLTKQLGGRRVVDGINLDVGQGELVCLLGPSGCGKTTTLRMVGGFISPDAGRIEIGGRDVTGLPPERRPTAMVFQNYALWPHMTVFKNIAYGLKLRKISKPEIEERVQAVLKMVNLTHLRDRHPAALSGGEQQRVALARALVLEPAVLLLDEPLSNLDAKLRVVVREEIKEIQQRLKITTVFVTHDQDEAMSIADRIAVMSAGRIEQYAKPEEIYRRPESRFVAGFVGTMNFFEGRIHPDHIVVGPSQVRLAVEEGALEGFSPDGGSFEIAVRPEDVEILLGEEDLDRKSVANLAREVPHGHYKEIFCQIEGGLVLRAFVPADTDAPSRIGVRIRRLLAYRNGSLVFSTPQGALQETSSSASGGGA